jgi:hypothetical protein
LRTMGKDWYLILHCHQVIPSSFHQNIFPSTPHFDSISDQAKVMYTNGTQCLNWVCHDLMNVIAQKKDLWKYSINLLKKKELMYWSATSFQEPKLWTISSEKTQS